MIKYQFQYYTVGGDLVRIEIYNDNYTQGVINIENGASEPLRQKIRGEKEKENIIAGQEWEFNIISDNTFDDLISSQYAEFYAIVNIAGYNIFQGWLKPENITREWLAYKYHISLSFTDGLGDLKEKPFKQLDGSFYDGTASILYVVRECLKKTGIEKNIKTMSSIWETSLMTEGQCALKMVEVDTRRFTKREDGKIEAMNCYDVLQEVLKPFHVTLKQELYYWITDYQENEWVRQNSTYQNLIQYSFSDLSIFNQSQTYPFYEISGLKFKPGGNYSKQHPLKKIDLTFRNRRVAEPIPAVNSWLDNWTIYGSTYNNRDHDFIELSILNTESNIYLESDVFSVSATNNTDYIRLNLQHMLKGFVPNTQYSGSTHEAEYIRMEADVYGVSYDGSTIDYFGTEAIGYMVYDDYTIWESGNEVCWKILGDGNYKIQIRFYIDHTDEYSRLIPRLEGRPDVRVETINENNETLENITFDRNYLLVQSGGFGKKEIETLFGDGQNTLEIGSLQITGVPTSKWRRYGRTSADDQPLLYHLSQKYLNARQSYRDIIQFSYKDLGNEINLHDVLIINAIGYEIFAMNKEYRSGWTEIQARRLYATDVSTSLTEAILNSIDGDGTQSGGTTVQVIGLLENEVIDLIRGAWGTFTGANLANRQIQIQHDLGYELVHVTLYQGGNRIQDANFEVSPDSTTQVTLTVNIPFVDVTEFKYRIS